MVQWGMDVSKKCDCGGDRQHGRAMIQNPDNGQLSIVKVIFCKTCDWYRQVPWGKTAKLVD
jgi:hypothetical protein